LFYKDYELQKVYNSLEVDVKNLVEKDKEDKKEDKKEVKKNDA
jgi:hypothetical protein